jgi:heme/copper-type cytochrome/quinol oxidase subunit 2
MLAFLGEQSGKRGGESRMRMTWIVAVIVVIATVGVGSILAFSYPGFSRQSSSGQPTPSSSSGQIVHFTIIESDPPDPLAGMNGSYYKPLGTQWPVIRVHQGDTVIITIINNNSREIHGFAIVHYDDKGFSLAPGQQRTISFVADEVGSFRMYCNVFCAIHPYMQNGEVIVSS